MGLGTVQGLSECSPEFSLAYHFFTFSSVSDYFFLSFLLLLLLLLFLGPLPRHMEIPRLGVESEL